MRFVLAGFGCLLIASPLAAFAADDPREWPAVYLTTLSGHDDKIRCVAVASGGIVASGGFDKTVRLWDGASGAEKHLLQHEAAVLCLAFAPDGRRLITGDARSHVQVWDVETGTKLRAFEGIAGGVQRVAIGDQTVAAVGEPSGILWEADTGRKRLGFDGGFALAPDDRTLALARADGSVQLLYLAEKKVNSRLEAFKEQVFAMAFSPDAKMLATAAFAGGQVEDGRDKSIKLWEVSSGKLLARLVGHKRAVYSLTFSPDGKRLLAADYNGSMKLWGVRSHTLRATLETVRRGDQLTQTIPGFWAISPDLKNWAVATGREVEWLDISDFASPH